MSRGAAARCPYCKSPGRIRNSEEVSLLHRDVYIDCANDACGHRWKAQLSFVHSISTPSGVPIDLPVTPHRNRRSPRDGEPPPVPVPA
ncbi:MAG: transcriptional regulator [Alphaproteobacteria bacterium HGW-Alphaproteobacteria-13]|jgi:hypothetical protein|nr:MAG: transcriptional regulator [Alphaproteobacteria bacterium HGW-Alphaproteobacteria-13]